MEPTANTPTVKEVVESLDRISVADYQRTYAWQKEQVEELFSDATKSAKDGDTHFLGALIFHQTGTRKADLVDGQQRLTTVFILVARLRDQLDDIGLHTITGTGRNARPIDVRKKAWDFLYANEDNFDEVRFLSNRFISRMMTKQVLAEPEDRDPLPQRDNQATLAFRKAVWTIEKLVREDLKNHDSNDAKLKRINELLDAVLNRFVVLQVRTGSLAESLDIFLTLNNRGLPLGPSDLVRGQVMMQKGLGESEREQLRIFADVLDEWQTIEESVKEPEIFLRHYLLATSRKSVTKKKVHDAVQKRIDDPDPAIRKQLANDFWTNVIEASDYYGQIVSPAMGGDCQYQLELLEGLTKSHRIVLLRALIQNVGVEIYAHLVRAVWVLTYRWVMSGGNAQELEDFYQSQANDVAEDDDFEKLIGNIRTKALGIEFDLLRYLRSEGDSSFACRALLHATNRVLAHGANAIALDSSLHLEHIAPQSRTDEWVDAVYEGDNLKAAEYETLISEIGNLTLLDFKLNIQAKRQLFDEKKKKYHRSTMVISRDLEDVDPWNEWMIKKRTEWLGSVFEIIWSVDPSSERISSFPSWLRNHLKR